MKAGQAGRESLKNITSNITTKIASNNPKRMFFRLILFHESPGSKNNVMGNDRKFTGTCQALTLAFELMEKAKNYLHLILRKSEIR